MQQTARRLPRASSIWVGVLFLVATISHTGNAQANCVAQAADYYDLPEILLRAIVQYESGGDASVVHVNTNGSRDIGLMQINEMWLPALAKQGISEADLLDGCVNVFVGAWILSGNYARTRDLWQAVGAYNAGFRMTPQRDARRVRYIGHIQSMLRRLKAEVR